MPSTNSSQSNPRNLLERETNWFAACGARDAETRPRRSVGCVVRPWCSGHSISSAGSIQHRPAQSWKPADELQRAESEHRRAVQAIAVGESHAQELRASLEHANAALHEARDHAKETERVLRDAKREVARLDRR